MGAGPICCIGDWVFFPKKGVYPIVSGNCSWLTTYRPNSCVGDIVACPGGGVMITGACGCLISGRPQCRIGDLAYSPKCGIGIAVTGNCSHIQCT